MFFPGFGTILNAVIMVITGSFGVFVGNKLPNRIRDISLSGLGLITIMVGVESFLDTSNAVIPLISILIGGIIGSLIEIEKKLESAGEWLKTKTYKNQNLKNNKSKNFVEGFVVASLIACVGPISILAPFKEIISNDLNLMYIKTGLDAIMVFIYSGTMGIGVIFSAISLLIVQGFFTLLAIILGNSFLNESMINELTSTGGLMILSIGLRLLNIKKLPTADMIPGLLIAPLIIKIQDFI
ncbi:MAG: hypothetical protein CL796_02390 [Chloroflexi bacterium]|jgi:uncharacterized membrane protein YqgA involved in biofilm formation|nr:hypothetical protein [Chloroflexota bacterium]|tara:strand:+ start:1317 stop:2036 length:720 start_codon:yes stop_codon:yes gene_type:complete